jgi:hypothetical protein
MGDTAMATEGLRKPEKALTAQFVKSIREPGKYFDGHGLFLRVRPNGQRQWVQRIMVRGKRCELGLGNPALVLRRCRRPRRGCPPSSCWNYLC